jgi:hypothetical protein
VQQHVTCRVVCGGRSVGGATVRVLCVNARGPCVPRLRVLLALLPHYYRFSFTFSALFYLIIQHTAAYPTVPDRCAQLCPSRARISFHSSSRALALLHTHPLPLLFPPRPAICHSVKNSALSVLKDFLKSLLLQQEKDGTFVLFVVDRPELFTPPPSHRDNDNPPIRLLLSPTIACWPLQVPSFLASLLFTVQCHAYEQIE